MRTKLMMMVLCFGWQSYAVDEEKAHTLVETTRVAFESLLNVDVESIKVASEATRLAYINLLTSTFEIHVSVSQKREENDDVRLRALIREISPQSS